MEDKTLNAKKDKSGIVVKFTNDEIKAIVVSANAYDKSIADYIRSVVLKSLL
jgi:hypothetical protein